MLYQLTPHRESGFPPSARRTPRDRSAPSSGSLADARQRLQGFKQWLRLLLFQLLTLAVQVWCAAGEKHTAIGRKDHACHMTRSFDHCPKAAAAAEVDLHEVRRALVSGFDHV